MRILALALVALLTACTTTPQGDAIARGQVVDLISTGLALTVDGATEANPLGLALIPLKLSAGWAIETYLEECEERSDAAYVLNTLSYAFAANNLAVLAGWSVAPYVGLVGGIAYWLFHEDIEPEAYSCPDPNWIRGGPNQVGKDLPPYEYKLKT